METTTETTTRGKLCRVITGLLLASSTVWAEAAIIEFAPAAQTVTLGDSAAVDLVISNLGDGTAPSLGAFDIDVRYDDTILALDEVLFGAFLGDAALFESVNSAIPSAGTVNLFEVSFLFDFELDALQPGAFTLATLVFDTHASGVAALSVDDVILGDAFGMALPLENSGPGSIAVVESSVPVPAPPVLSLMTLGLAALWLMRLRQPAGCHVAARTGARSSCISCV